MNLIASQGPVLPVSLIRSELFMNRSIGDNTKGYGNRGLLQIIVESVVYESLNLAGTDCN